MTATATEQTWQVGQRISSRATFEALPVGTVIRGRRTWTKQSDGRWVRTPEGSTPAITEPSSYFSLDNRMHIESLPEVISPFPVGHRPGNAEEFAACPVGTVVIYNENESNRWRKVAEDSWLREGDTNPTGTDDSMMAGRNTIVSLPGQPVAGEEVPPNCLQIGDRVANLWEGHCLPVGTRVQANGRGPFYEKIRQDAWCEESLVGSGTARTYRNATFSSGEWTITHYPEGYEPEAPTEKRQETLGEFKRRLWLASIGQARASGVSVDPVERALRAIGVDPTGYDVVPGMRMGPGNYMRFDARLQPGTVVYIGDPTTRQFHGVFEVDRDRGFIHLLGGWTEATGELVVESVPGEPDTSWMGEPAADEADKIDALKVRAWRVGVRAKNEQGWCGSFEIAMSSVGITQEWVEQAPCWLTGEFVSAEKCRELPEGSILRWSNPEDRGEWEFYRRESGATNRAGTRFLFGSRGPTSRRNLRDRMEVVYDVSATGLRLPIDNNAMLTHAPIGTKISRPGNVVYEKVNEGRWRYNGTTYSINDFIASTFAISEFPS